MFIKKLSVKKLITTTAIVTLIVAAMFVGALTASNNQAIQATLARDITIVYDGDVQIMRDVNNNTVHPLLYNGTTYLPVRAVAGMLNLPVDWDGDTQTVFLGEIGDTRNLLDVSTHTTNATGGRAFRGDAPLPSGGSGNSSGYRFENINFGAGGRRIDVELGTTWSTITFATYAEGTVPVLVRITCVDNGIDIFNENIDLGVFRQHEVELHGTRKLQIEVRADSSQGGVVARQSSDVWILNPIVYR